MVRFLIWNAARSSLVYIEMKRVTLRNIRGSLGLGLLASLAAHVALFGDRHAVGGVYHWALLQMASAVALGFVAFLGTFAWALSRKSSDRRILAARLREQLPSMGSIVASTVTWYVGIEATEPHHVAAPTIALVAVLAASSYLVCRLAHAMATTLAHVAVTLSHQSFSPRLPAWRRIPRGRVVSRHADLARRRLARPPPIAFTFSHA